MTTNQRVTGRAMSMPAGMGLGLGLSVLLTVVGCAILAWLLGNETLPEESMGYGAMVILLLASWAGSLTAALLIRHRKLLVCLGTGGSYLALLLLVNGLAFGGSLKGLWVTALLILGGCAAAAALTAGWGKGHKKSPYGKNIQKFRLSK